MYTCTTYMCMTITSLSIHSTHKFICNFLKGDFYCLSGDYPMSMTLHFTLLNSFEDTASNLNQFRVLLQSFFNTKVFISLNTERRPVILKLEARYVERCFPFENTISLSLCGYFMFHDCVNSSIEMAAQSWTWCAVFRTCCARVSCTSRLFES